MAGRDRCAVWRHPCPKGGAGIRSKGREITNGYFDAEAAAATFFAAFAAFAAVEALRRRLVFGGVAGASPISSAVIMLVTNSFGPWSSKSTDVRSWSEAVTIPRPYTSCLMVCPSCIDCTTSSWTHSTRNKLFWRVLQHGPKHPEIYWLETCNVLRLKALGTLFYFELNSLPLIQRLIAIHHDRGEVHEDIFAGLPLDKAITLWSIEPLHCTLFLWHCCRPRVWDCIASLGPFPGRRSGKRLGAPSAVTSFSPQKKAAKFVLAALLNESKGNTRATNARNEDTTKTLFCPHFGTFGSRPDHSLIHWNG